jgi:hypothetical protein
MEWEQEVGSISTLTFSFELFPLSTLSFKTVVDLWQQIHAI